ncbi:MAG: extracellular solute-binding protein [Rhodopirellula sp.]|nr:extracellular solute-binding protein [Rhodopirellula sp.]
MTFILRPFSIVTAGLVPLLTAGLLASTFTGCRNGDSPGETSHGSAPAGTAIQLVVVDDPAMAAAIGQLRAEFRGQSGWDVDVRQLTASELNSAGAVEADALIVSSSQLGTLAQRDLLLPLPDELARSSQAQWSEIFDLIRSREAVWSNRVMAVPFGSGLLTCYYRADLFERLNLKPPATWKDYQRITSLLSDRDRLGDAAPPPGQQWRGTLEPLAPGWASVTLLARAAAYASHRGNYSTLFDIETMEPLIDGPPFVRALEELMAVAGPDGTELLTQDPTTIRNAFWAGQCGMALTWPTATAAIAAGPDENRRVEFAEMPGSQDVYNVTDRAWETRRRGESPHVPLLASAGRLGGVLRTSKWPDESFQLLLWLSDPQWSEQVCTATPATTLFRRSHLKNAGKWVEDAVPVEAAVAYAELTEAAFTRQQSLAVLRIPGSDEYLAALDDAVHRAVRGEVTASKSLEETAIQWREITERLGVEPQRKAYGNSLGLD